MTRRQIAALALNILLMLIGVWVLLAGFPAGELIGAATLLAAIFLFPAIARRHVGEPTLNVGQSAALLIAILLMLPGGCLVMMGVGFRPSGIPDSKGVMIGSVVLVIAALLLCVGLYRRPDRPGEPPPPQT
jgi:hypothetical protein